MTLQLQGSTDSYTIMLHDTEDSYGYVIDFFDLRWNSKRIFLQSNVYIAVSYFSHTFKKYGNSFIPRILSTINVIYIFSFYLP